MPYSLAARGAEILALIEQEFTAAGFVLVDQDGDVNDVQVERAMIESAFLLSATESSAVFDVEANQTWRVSVEFLNLLNRRDHDIDYAYTSQITPTATPAFTDVFHPVEPFQVRFGLHYTFGSKSKLGSTN